MAMVQVVAFAGVFGLGMCFALLGSISVIGLPPFGGSWSKWYLAIGTAEAGQLPLMAILMMSENIW